MSRPVLPGVRPVLLDLLDFCHVLWVLARAIEEHGLEGGDIGAVVHRYDEGEAFEVEFVTGEGRTVAVLTLERGDIRPMDEREILHARAMAAA